MSVNISKIIESCGKNRVKSIKFQENNFEIEFFPESGDQLTPIWHPSLQIDQKNPDMDPKIKEELRKLQEEDENVMSILEDPSSYEENLIKEMLGEDNEE